MTKPMTVEAKWRTDYTPAMLLGASLAGFGGSITLVRVGGKPLYSLFFRPKPGPRKMPKELPKPSVSRDSEIAKYLDLLRNLELYYEQKGMSEEAYQRLRTEYISALEKLGYDVSKLREDKKQSTEKYNGH